MYTYKVRLMFDKTGPCIFFTCIRNNFIYISSFQTYQLVRDAASLARSPLIWFWLP